MGNRGSFGRRDEYGAAGNPELVVDKILYTSYDVVKYVAENVVAIQNVNSKMEDIQEANSNIEIISAVATQIDKIFAIGSNIDAVVGVNTNMPKITALFEDLALLVNLNAALPQIVKVSDEMNKILYLVSNMTKVEQAVDIIPDLLLVIDQKDEILASVQDAKNYADTSKGHAQTASDQKVLAEQASTLAAQRATAAATSANNAGTYASNGYTSAERASSARAEAETIREQVRSIRDTLLSGISATAVGVPSTSPAKATYNPNTKVITLEIPAGPSGSGVGDMLKQTYDPSGKSTDAFSMGNMTETVTAKVMTGGERIKLAGIAEGADKTPALSTVATTGNYADLAGKPTIKDGTVTSVGITPPTGMKASADITTAGKIVLDFLAGFSLLTDAQSSKLAGIAAAATANASDAQLRDRSTHTGSQPISSVTGLSQAISDGEKLANKGQANGYASLDANGKVPLGQMNESVLGAMSYKGTWNASTNSPAIPAANNANKGHYYIVTVSGATNIGGVQDWKVGDWIVSNGTSWDKIDSTDQVTMVNGKQGNVILTKDDIGLNNVNNTPDMDKPVSNPQLDALANRVSKAGDTMVGPLAAPTVRLVGAKNTERMTEVYTNGVLRLKFGGTYDDETGGNKGTDFGIFRYADNGDYIDGPFRISRDTGLTTITGVRIGNKASAADIAAAAADKFPDAAAVKAALADATTFDPSMTWQNMISQRAISTVYQNTSGKTIIANPAGYARYGYCEGEVSANGTDWFRPPRPFQVQQSDTTYYYAFPSLIVPNGHYYRLLPGNSYLGLTTWWEFR